MLANLITWRLQFSAAAYTFLMDENNTPVPVAPVVDELDEAAPMPEAAPVEVTEAAPAAEAAVTEAAPAEEPAV